MILYSFSDILLFFSDLAQPIHLTLTFCFSSESSNKTMTDQAENRLTLARSLKGGTKTSPLQKKCPRCPPMSNAKSGFHPSLTKCFSYKIKIVGMFFLTPCCQIFYRNSLLSS